MTIISLLSLIILLTFSARGSAFEFTDDATKKNDLKTYIIHVKQPEAHILAHAAALSGYHLSFMAVDPAAASEKQEHLLYSYKNVISGFAARLTEEDMEIMKEMDGFISAHPERILHQQTTHSPQFLGLNQETGFWKESNFGKGVIIGIVDGGILPSHPSFSDEGMPPPPAKWKGKCEFTTSNCNNKIIGARSFNNSAMAMTTSPVDENGHGTHLAGIAAGRLVKNANVLGLANGTAIGVAPQAHLAIYKVCVKLDNCPESDILAGIDAAVDDGVDVISISIVGKFSVPFFQDVISVASFGAVQKGIFVSCSAGNTGPSKSTVSNEAPWILTVGASTINRSFKVVAKLGNGEEFNGETLFQPQNFSAALMPLIYAGSSGKPNSSFCAEGSLDEIDVKGKVVLCERGVVTRLAKGDVVKKSGGAAMILMNQEPDGSTTIAEAHVLPATHVGYATGLKIKAYVNSTASPVAAILFKGTSIGDPLAPVVASFSSRGPSIATPGILKPDIIGPGVNIVSAWPFSVDGNPNERSTFNVQSGTSMSCPHLSGVAALLKSAHPSWSPAAIKSAIMTTADLLNQEKKPIADENFMMADVFAIGAGHVNPSRANDPGLVYDIHPNDYIPYLCGLGYTDDQVGIVAQRRISCANESSIPEAQLNYPSFSIKLGSENQSYTRTVTNVGGVNSSYCVKIIPPTGVLVSVKPERIYFTEVNQQLSYQVTFNRSAAVVNSLFVQGYLRWTSAHHTVTSPISVKLE